MNLALTLDRLSKSYGPLTVFSDLSFQFSAPQIYCLSAPSGAGKTTLFRLVMGLEKPDDGQIHFSTAPVRFSTVFQEDRLIEHLSPVENILLVLDEKNSRNDIFTELMYLLPEEALNRPVSTLSGGMKRRCAFLRAVMAPSDVVIMDEPFTGLDADTKELVIRYLLTHTRDRLFLIATHSPEDIKRLGASIFYLNE